MMNSLPQKKVHKSPQYFMDKIGRVVSAANYRTQGTIEVKFLDHGNAMPVWMVGDLTREPVEGDMVIIGYMEGRKDAPYLRGFVKTDYYTANYIDIGKDFIRLQIPTGESDRNQKMTTDSYKNSRVYLEINANGSLAINSPTGNIYLNTPKGNVQIVSKTGTQTF